MPHIDARWPLAVVHDLWRNVGIQISECYLSSRDWIYVALRTVYWAIHPRRLGLEQDSSELMIHKFDAATDRRYHRIC